MVTTIIVGVVALVVGAVAGILFTNNNVKKVQTTLDYFEGVYYDLEADLHNAYEELRTKDKRITELENPVVAKTAKVKKAAS